MASSYKRLGDCIRLVDVRNSESEVELLLGLSIDKIFIPSVANTVGTDMRNYKIIKKGQFACSLMQVRRDKKIPVALMHQYGEALISQAYSVFEVCDEEELLPEYLMMWMSRSEFDRHACFLAVGGVRGSLEWEDFCNMELPVPDIDVQREIVREFNVIINRIKLNEQLCAKLEEAAQALYKHWFVDFEFPISSDYASSIGKPELEGKPYKSSGGEMKYCSVLDRQIPSSWSGQYYENVIDFKTGKLNSNAAVEDGVFPFFTCSSETFKTNTYAFDCEAVLLAGNNASAVYPLKFFRGKFDAYQRTYVVRSKVASLTNEQIYLSLQNELEGFKGTSSGTATKFLTLKILNDLKLVAADDLHAEKLRQSISPLFDLKLKHEIQFEKLSLLKGLLLSKLATQNEGVAA